MNIIQYNYNYTFFNDILSKKMEVRNSTPALYETILSRMFKVGVIERSNTMPKGINTKSMFPIPSMVEGITLQQCIDDSVKRIKTKATLPIVVVFDGSIDNLLVIKSLYESGVEFSIRTEQDLYDKHKPLFDKVGKEVKIEANSFYGNLVKTNNIVSSTLGKLIIGCDYVYDFMRETGEYDESVMNESFELIYDYASSYSIGGTKEDIKVQIESLLKLSPYNIETLYQSIHWLSYLTAYQGIWFEKMDNSSRLWKAVDSVINFYHTDMFQRYALNSMKAGYKGFKVEAIEMLDKFYDTTELFNQVDIVTSDIRFIAEDYTQFRDSGLF